MAVLVDRRLSAYSLRLDRMRERGQDVSAKERNLRSVLRPALQHFKDRCGDLSANDFSSARLFGYQTSLADSGLYARTYINRKLVPAVRRLFAWARKHELIPATTAVDLRDVEGLQVGDTLAHEVEPVRPVDDAVVEATLKTMLGDAVDLLRLMRCTGMRPGEACVLRWTDVELGDGVWLYRPHRHKNQWRGHTRIIGIGPRGQAILEKYRDRNPFIPVFSPRETLVTLRGRAPDTDLEKAPRAEYDTSSISQAIRRGCARAFPPPADLTRENRIQWVKDHRWSANQLRHSWATAVRKSHGLEAASAGLGHEDIDTTLIYAERDLGLVKKIAAEVG